MRVKKDTRSPMQKQADAALAEWRHRFWFVFKLRCVTIPFAVINSISDIPHTDYCFKYKEVFIFGVRVARIQTR
jgi:hypothetical protein